MSLISCAANIGPRSPTSAGTQSRMAFRKDGLRKSGSARRSLSSMLSSQRNIIPRETRSTART